MIDETITPEEIARQYSAAMDSVNLIDAGKPQNMSQEEWDDCVRRNVEHLKIMVAKPYWTYEDLTPLTAIIDAYGNE